MSKVSVLVVDDAPFIRDLVKKCLRNYFPGIVIEDAVNGRKAQTLLSRQAFDLVLCDWEMPEMSGLELLTWCRQQESMKTLPFIMVTSRGDKENVVQAIQAGVSDFVGKPFTNEQLLTKVKKALTKVGKLDTLLASAPTRATSAFANDSLSALTGGRAESVKASAPAAPVVASQPLVNAPRPTAAAPAAKATSTTHHKKAKHHKKAATTEQKAQAAKKHAKKAPVAQKAQAAKKAQHHKKAAPVAQKAQAAKKTQHHKKAAPATAAAPKA